MARFFSKHQKSSFQIFELLSLILQTFTRTHHLFCQHAVRFTFVNWERIKKKHICLFSFYLVLKFITLWYLNMHTYTYTARYLFFLQFRILWIFSAIKNIFTVSQYLFWYTKLKSCIRPMYVCVCMFECVCECVHARTCVYLCACVCVCVCVYSTLVYF